MSEQTLVSKKYRKRSKAGEIWHHLRKNKGAMIGLVFIILLIGVALTVDMWLDYELVIAQSVKERLQKPSIEHWMGTDEYGRDVFCRLLYGAKFSVLVGFVAIAIALAFGVTLGAIAGYYGGILENLIMRGLDIFGAIPSVLMGIVIVSALGANIFNLMIAVGLTSVPGFARVTRASVLTVRNQEYVEAARAIGIFEWKIIFSHIIPNCLSPIIVQTTLRVGSAIISASSLSFLGLGMPEPTPEWGSMLSGGRQYLRGNSYLTLFPGLAIMITVLAFNMLGDGLRDALDPKLKR